MIHNTQSVQISQEQDEHNRASCAKVHELPQSHCGDNREGTIVFIYICIYI